VAWVRAGREVGPSPRLDFVIAGEAASPFDKIANPFAIVASIKGKEGKMSGHGPMLQYLDESGAIQSMGVIVSFSLQPPLKSQTLDLGGVVVALRWEYDYVSHIIADSKEAAPAVWHALGKHVTRSSDSNR